MPQLYLPADHTEADLVLAGQVAELVASAELYVAWTPEHGQAIPAIPAVLREAAPGPRGTLTLFLQAARELWAAFRGRDTSAALPARPLAQLPAPKPAA